MIFVCVGSREYQFNRLLKKLDDLVTQGELSEPIFAQIGQSTYLPKYYEYKRFMSVDEFKLYQKKANIIISHGGTGALIGALKMNKKVLAVPRLAEFGEHIDDHQTQVVEVLTKQGYLQSVLDINKLLKGIQILKNYEMKKFHDEPSKIIEIIEDFISNN